MKKSRYTVLAVLLLAATSPNVHSQDPETVQEWKAFITEGKFMPDISPEVIRDMLGAAKPGRSFSEVFDPLKAQQVFFDKVVAQQECFFETKPNGELPQEECSNTRGSPLGPESASLMVYNVDAGSVRYMNRGRDPKAAEPAKLTVDQAAEALKTMSIELGVPPEELGRLQMRELIVAGADSEKPGAPEFEQRTGVFGLISRCMPVQGEVLIDCIPVVDGGIRAAMVDGGRREPPVVTAWYEARYNKFEILAGVKPLTQDEVVTKIAEKLSREAVLGSYDLLEIKVTYATNAELAGQSGDTHCPPDEPDEEDAIPSAVEALPSNLLTDRSYLPAVQVFALPQGWDESRTIDPDKLNSLSTGISVFSVALAQGESGECARSAN